MKRTALALLVLIAWPNFSLATVRTLSFAEAPGSLGITEIGKLVAKFFDENGQGVPAGETVNLALSSSCPGGQFSSNDTKWEPVAELRVNSNWSSRTFYYKDTSAGSCTVRASVAGKDWTTAETTIAIGETTGGNGESDAETNLGNSGGENDVNKKSDSKETKPKKIANQLSIDIGKKIITTAGVPVSLKAKVEGIKGITGAKVNWSFGDGGAGMGRELNHVYDYAGLYTIVAGVVNGDEQAEARVEAEVVEPKVVITEIVDGGRAIALENKASNEVRLDGSKLMAAGQSFIFPANTIIKKGAKIIISQNISGLRVLPSDEIALVSPTGREMSSRNYKWKEVSWRELNRGEIAAARKELAGLAGEIKQIKRGYAKIGGK